MMLSATCQRELSFLYRMLTRYVYDGMCGISPSFACCLIVYSSTSDNKIMHIEQLIVDRSHVRLLHRVSVLIGRSMLLRCSDAVSDCSLQASTHSSHDFMSACDACMSSSSSSSYLSTRHQPIAIITEHDIFTVICCRQQYRSRPMISHKAQSNISMVATHSEDQYSVVLSRCHV